MGKIIAIYMRLSVSDDDFEQDESNSIKAQRDLIYQYINEKEEFKGCKGDQGLFGKEPRRQILPKDQNTCNGNSS